VARTRDFGRNREKTHYGIETTIDRGVSPVLSSRNREKTHYGIETVEAADYAGLRSVETGRKPTTGLKLDTARSRRRKSEGRNREKTHYGIETRRPSRSMTRPCSRNREKTHYGIETTRPDGSRRARSVETGRKPTTGLKRPIRRRTRRRPSVETGRKPTTGLKLDGLLSPSGERVGSKQGENPLRD